MSRRLTIGLVWGFVFFAAAFLTSCGGSSSSTATAGGGKDGPVVLTAIQVNPSVATIAQGTSKAFTAMGNYSDGSTKDLTAAVQWSCLLPNLATVSSNPPTQCLAAAKGGAT